MNNTEKLSFIEGNFSDLEAKEIILNIYNSKINYQKIKNLSTHESSGKEDTSAMKNISELRKEIEKAELIISEAKNQKKKLIITSEIKISLSDN